MKNKIEKIKPLVFDIDWDADVATIYDLKEKINEIIDYLNSPTGKGK